jgi:hypothetical protein
MPVTATAAPGAFLVEVVTVYTVLVCPLLAKPGNFARFLIMTHGTFANFLRFVTLMIKFHIMLKVDNIICQSALGKQHHNNYNHLHSFTSRIE